MWFYELFTGSLIIDILTKVLLAFILSSIIGIERELIHKPAGIKTHTLICISATLVMALGMYLFDLYGNVIDPSRLPAQIIAGIGFVGAGTIIRDGFSVKGITTAASLLTITCIGLAVGAGFYEGAIVTTLLTFLILSLTVPFQRFVHNKGKLIMFTIVSTPPYTGILGKVEEIFEDSEINILSVKQIGKEMSQYITLRILVKCTDMKLREYLTQRLCDIKNVKEVHTSKRISNSED